MDKLEYFLLCMNSGTYKIADWVRSVFCVFDKRPLLSDATYDYQVIFDPSDLDALFVAVPHEGKRHAVKLTGSKKFSPLYHAKEACDIKAGALPLQHDDINTTYGIILGNMYLLHYPFGNKFKFINGEIGGSFEDTLASLLTDDVKEGEQELDDRIYVREYLLYGEACGALGGFDRIFASSGSPKALTVAPEVLQLRDKLIAENKHQLHDRTVQAKIEEQLVAADKKSFENDPARDFLITSKSFNPTRKKQLIMIGGSSGFGNDGDASFIPTSLRDRWKVEDIPVHANEARAGSYFRGKETQYGGYDVKVSYRMAMNSRVAMDFCGTTRGKPIALNETNAKQVIGLYAVTPKGPVLIDKDNVKNLIGKTFMYYSPQYCKVDGSSYCATCIGKTYSRLPNGLPSVVASIGDVYMYDKMKRMHGKAMTTAVLNLKAISY